MISLTKANVSCADIVGLPVLYPLVQRVSCCTMGHASLPPIPVIFFKYNVPYTEQQGFRLFARGVFQSGPTIFTPATLPLHETRIYSGRLHHRRASPVVAEPSVGFRAFRTTLQYVRTGLRVRFLKNLIVFRFFFLLYIIAPDTRVSLSACPAVSFWKQMLCTGSYSQACDPTLQHCQFTRHSFDIRYAAEKVQLRRVKQPTGIGQVFRSAPYRTLSVNY